MKETLLLFCGAKYPEPFSWNEYTYATNGHVLIKVPLLPEFANSPGPDLKGFEEKVPIPPQYISLKDAKGLDPVLVDCSYCEGTNIAHPSCPNCRCKCDLCKGTGKETYYPQFPGGYEIEGTYFNCKYIRALKGLPDCEIGVNKIEIANDYFPASRFRFSGGEGFIMPLKK